MEVTSKDIQKILWDEIRDFIKEHEEEVLKRVQARLKEKKDQDEKAL